MEEPEQIAATERLLIRKVTRAEAGFIHRLLNTPGWLQFIGDRGIDSEEAAARYLENNALRHYAEKGYGSYCVALKESGTPIGMCGFVKRDGLEYPDFGFALLQEYEGKGYMFEASVQLLRMAHELVPEVRISAITAQNNTRSMNLLQRLGFLHMGTVFLPNDSEELNLFDLQLPVR